MLVTELIISYATSAPPLSYMPCVLSVSGSSCLPRGLAATAHSGGRAGQAKPRQAKPRQARPAGGSFSSDVFGIFLSCVSLALAPAPAYNSPPSDAEQPPVPSIAADSLSFILKCDLEH